MTTMDIHQALNLRLKLLSQQEKVMGVATVRCMKTASDRISRLLVRFNITNIHIPTKRNAHFCEKRS
jgi:hypothetical protein